MPTTEVTSNGVVHTSDMPGKDVSIKTSGEKLNFPKGSPSSKYVVYATAYVYRELYGKITDRKKNSILLEGGVTVSNNFTKRRQNGFKIGTRDKFATHLR